MPDFLDREIPCPHCHAPQRLRMYERVNTDRHPEWKPMIMDGSLFDLTCTACGQTTRVGYPMLYHDPAKKLIVMLAENDNRAEAYASLQTLVGEPFPLDKGYTVRAVTQPPELAEKITVFDSGLDDRIVELLKLMVCISWASEHDEKLPERVFLNDADKLEFLVFPNAQADPLLCHFTQADYAECRKLYSAFFPAGLKENLFVDRAWTDRLLTPSHRLQ